MLSQSFLLFSVKHIKNITISYNFFYKFRVLSCDFVANKKYIATQEHQITRKVI